MIVETLGRGGINLVRDVFREAGERRRQNRQDPDTKRFNLIMTGASVTLLVSTLGLEYMLQCQGLANFTGNLGMVLSGVSFLQQTGFSE